MKITKKLLLITLCVIMLLTCVSSFAAEAADPYSIYVVLNDDAVPSAKEGEANTSHIKLVDGYLYLPSMTDMSKVKFYFEGDGELKIKADKSGGKSATFKSGDFVDVKALFESCSIENYRYPITVSNSKGQTAYFNIMKSENLPAIFLTVPTGNMNFINSIKGNQEAGTAFVIDVDGKVYFATETEVNPGDFVNVEILDYDEYDLTGKTVD